MQPILFALATFASTLAGGFIAIRFKNKLHGVMALAAGILLGVVFFEIFPEIITQVNKDSINPMWVMGALVGGFLLFHILEKTILIHHSHEEDYADHKHPHAGVLSALALAGHSFLDGMGIGLGFQINPGVGLMMAMASISHGFTDGMNTVSFMLMHKNSVKKSRLFLFVDALAPVAGAFSTLFFQIPIKTSILFLGFFAGFLLYIGASDILPEAHRDKSSFGLIALTILGVALVFGLSFLA